MLRLQEINCHGVLLAAAISGALAVMLGAFGAHALRAELDLVSMRVFHTAVQYHFYHTFTLALVAVTMRAYGNSRWLSLSALFFISGLIVFSGSLYLLATLSISWLGALTPVGGLAFIFAWLCLAMGAIQQMRKK